MLAQLPRGPKAHAAFLGGWPLVMWAQSKVKDATFRFIKYVTDPAQAMSDFCYGAGQLPGRKSLADKAPWTAMPNKIFIDQLNFAYPYQYPYRENPPNGVPGGDRRADGRAKRYAGAVQRGSGHRGSGGPHQRGAAAVGSLRGRRREVWPARRCLPPPPAFPPAIGPRRARERGQWASASPERRCLAPEGAGKGDASCQ